VIDQTTYSWGMEGRYLQSAPVFGLASRFSAGIQYFETQQNDVQFVNILGRRTQTKLHNQINQALKGL